MENKIETLRSLLFTKEDYDTITNIKDILPDVTDKDIEFMWEFKKIYELGLGQLKDFIDKLECEGWKELDIYSILYYMEVLRNGPLGSYLPDLTKDKKNYWPKHTNDAIGLLGNKNKSPQNVTIYQGMEYQLGSEVNTNNKLPGFMQTTTRTAIQITEDMFRSSLMSSSMIDNTLPIVDKKPQVRYGEEPTGSVVLRPNAYYMVKDRYFYLEVEAASAPIFKKVEDEFLDNPKQWTDTFRGKQFTVKADNFRMYKTKKQYSAFDSGENPSEATNVKQEKEFTLGDNKEIITLDLMGDEFDSEERRASVLKVSNPVKDEEFILNTNEGQLGN